MDTKRLLGLFCRRSRENLLCISSGQKRFFSLAWRDPTSNVPFHPISNLIISHKQCLNCFFYQKQTKTHVQRYLIQPYETSTDFFICSSGNKSEARCHLGWMGWSDTTQPTLPTIVRYERFKASLHAHTHPQNPHGHRGGSPLLESSMYQHPKKVKIGNLMEIKEVLFVKEWQKHQLVIFFCPERGLERYPGQRSNAAAGHVRRRRVPGIQAQWKLFMHLSLRHDQNWFFKEAY